MLSKQEHDAEKIVMDIDNMFDGIQLSQQFTPVNCP